MSPRFWMITNRRRDGETLNSECGPVTYWVADGGDPTILTTWTKVGATAFKTLLAQAAIEKQMVLKSLYLPDGRTVPIAACGANTPGVWTPLNDFAVKHWPMHASEPND